MIDQLQIQTTIAARRARENLDANNAAFGAQVDWLDLDWTLGRDGATTALDADQQWISGCSVPRRAAMTQLRKMEVVGPVACFLAAPHAAAIRVALERLRPEQACIVIVPEERDWQRMLHCEDFSADVAKHRIFLAHGGAWAEQLGGLFERQPGMSIPTQFIRLPGTPQELIDSLIVEAQAVFSRITSERADALRRLRDQWRPSASRRPICIVAASHSRLWQDWGAVLAGAMGTTSQVVRVDPDNPLEASSLFVARAAVGCDAIVTIDLSRADVPGVVSDQMPWVTWCISGRIPQRLSCGTQDRLMVLSREDLDAAKRAGWEPDRVVTAAPPVGSTLVIDDSRDCGESFVAVVADTSSIKPPDNIDEFSSHRVLWESVADELVRNPFAVGDDASGYLDSRMQMLQISDETLNRTSMMEKLIIPAYQQGIVRMLVAGAARIRIFGEGWDAAGVAAEPARDRKALAAKLASATAFVHIWPEQKRPHAIDFAGKPVVRPGGSRMNLLREMQDAMSGKLPVATHCQTMLSGALIRKLLTSE